MTPVLLHCGNKKTCLCNKQSQCYNLICHIWLLVVFFCCPTNRMNSIREKTQMLVFIARVLTLWAAVPGSTEFWSLDAYGAKWHPITDLVSHTLMVSLNWSAVRRVFTLVRKESVCVDWLWSMHVLRNLQHPSVIISICISFPCICVQKPLEAFTYIYRQPSYPRDQVLIANDHTGLISPQQFCLSAPVDRSHQVIPHFSQLSHFLFTSWKLTCRLKIPVRSSDLSSQIRREMLTDLTK